MRYASKTTILSLMFLAGAAAAAQAQSVANLPSAGSQPAAVQPPAYSAPQATKPNPGGNVSIPSGPAFQKPADWTSNRAYHPYTTSGTGPAPGSNVTANNEPNSSPPGANVAAPYSTKGAGPAAGANVVVPSSR